MKISIATLFPEMFPPVFNASILKKAQEKKLIAIEYINIRNFGIGRHKVVDDKPYGGGVGMILRVDVVHNAISNAKCSRPKTNKCRELTILLDPQGKKFSQPLAYDLTKADHLILVCGHYEGIDERIRKFVDMEISIGDYILTGGEIPAIVVVDAVTRLIPGVLEKEAATKIESFSLEKHLLEHSQYTRPKIYKKNAVPLILLSGNHQEIEKWRIKESITKTKKKRPDLISTL